MKNWASDLNSVLKSNLESVKKLLITDKKNKMQTRVIYNVNLDFTYIPIGICLSVTYMFIYYYNITRSM